MVLDILLLIGLILLNGLFAMAELAVVSARKARLQARADAGSLGARSALELHAHPSIFLSTVQVGITLVGVSSGAVGDAVIAEPLAQWLTSHTAAGPYANEIAMAITVVGITYFSVVVGELVPKRLALLAPETLASVLALPMTALARLARPLVWVFSTSSELLLRIIGARRGTEPPVTNAEIEVLMEQGAEAGVFHASEQELVANVLRLDERRLGAIMTPRVDIEYVDLEDPPETLTRMIIGTDRNVLVVCRDGLENVVGILHVVDLLKQRGGTAIISATSVEAVLRSPRYVPKSLTTVQLLEQFRRSRQKFALVIGEYGDIQGIVTLTDVMTAIVGDLEPELPPDQREILARDDGSWLCDGSLSVELLRAVIRMEAQLPGEEEDEFHTLGGFVMHVLGRVPRVGESFSSVGHRFEVVDMDGNRIDKVLVVPVPSNGEMHAVQVESPPSGE
ncbi:MAG: hemolysin family protein [Gammaproteobacteria bacterium]